MFYLSPLDYHSGLSFYDEDIDVLNGFALFDYFSISYFSISPYVLYFFSSSFELCLLLPSPYYNECIFHYRLVWLLLS